MLTPGWTMAMRSAGIPIFLARFAVAALLAITLSICRSAGNQNARYIGCGTVRSRPCTYATACARANLAAIHAIGAIKPLPARTMSGLKDCDCQSANAVAFRINRHRGRKGNSDTRTPSGAWVFAPIGAIHRVVKYFAASAARCQFSRSIPPHKGGKLRVINNSLCFAMDLAAEASLRAYRADL